MKGAHAMNILSDTVIETGLSDLPAPLPPSDLLPNVLYRTGLSDLCWQAESPIGPLLIAASRDDVVPPAAMTALWEATGRPPLVWYDTTHVGTAAFALPVMRDVAEFFRR